MNTLSKLCQHVKGFRYPYLDSPRSINRSLRLVHTLTKSLLQPVIVQEPSKSQSEAPDHLNPDPFASCLNIKQPQKILQDFISREDVRSTALENGVCERELPSLLTGFAKYYSANWRHSLDINVILSDIEKEHRHITDLLQPFLRFAYSHRSEAENLHKTEAITREMVDKYHTHFPDAREFKRRITMHVGTTNSGKTYQATQRYLHAESGVYVAPLRMLAYETYVRTNNEGVDCDMVTGEEKKYKHSADKPSAHISCTVEMVPTDMALYKVGVIDEIQMIGDPERGGGWTKALFGICCEELHICGHESAVNIVKRLLERTGEEVEVRTYDRLTPLTMAPTHLNGNLSSLAPGDCIITFNRIKLHILKSQIEAKTGIKCSIIYGNLPPRVRLEQIALFNDPNSPYNITVASDAIGLGVNLNIKRIIFEDLYKIWSGKRVLITAQHTNQIAGRAGRFLSQYPNGEVTCLYANHYNIMKNLLSTPIPDISKAVLTPPSDVWTKLDYIKPGCDVIQHLDLMKCTLPEDSDFQMISPQKYFKSNDLFKLIGIPSVTSLSLFNCFVNLKHEFVYTTAQPMLSAYADGRIFKYEDVLYSSSWPHPPPVSIRNLELYEDMSEVCDFYLWLHQRNPISFPDRVKIRNLQAQIARTIGDTLLCPSIVDGQEVLYLPDSDYEKRFSAYHSNAF